MIFSNPLKKAFFGGLSALFFLSIVLLSSCKKTTPVKSSAKEVTEVKIGSVTVTKTKSATKGEIAASTTLNDGTAPGKAIRIAVKGVAATDALVKTNIKVSPKATVTIPSAASTALVYAAASNNSNAVPITVTAEDGTKKHYSLIATKTAGSVNSNTPGATLTIAKIKVGGSQIVTPAAASAAKDGTNEAKAIPVAITVPLGTTDNKITLPKVQVANKSALSTADGFVGGEEDLTLEVGTTAASGTTAWAVPSDANAVLKKGSQGNLIRVKKGSSYRVYKVTVTVDTRVRLSNTGLTAKTAASGGTPSTSVVPAAPTTANDGSTVKKAIDLVITFPKSVTAAISAGELTISTNSLLDNTAGNNTKIGTITIAQSDKAAGAIAEYSSKIDLATGAPTDAGVSPTVAGNIGYVVVYNAGTASTVLSNFAGPDNGTIYKIVVKKAKK